MLGCLPCMLEGYGAAGDCRVMADIQHVLDESGEKRLGHDATYGSCPWHHRGLVLRDDLSEADMQAIFGPSMQHSKREFVSRYGPELQLVELQTGLIAEAFEGRHYPARWMQLRDYREQFMVNPEPDPRAFRDFYR